MTSGEVRMISNGRQMRTALRTAKDQKKLVVLEFMEPSNQASINMKPVYQEVASSLQIEADFYELNVNEFMAMARRFQVDKEKLPTFLIVKNGVVEDRVDGVVEDRVDGVATKEALETCINNNKFIRTRASPA